MAEQITITTALVGLLVVGGKMIDILWDLDVAPEAQTAFINQALQSVKQCRSSLYILFKTLSHTESSELPFPERGSWIQVDNLVAILTDSVLAFSELCYICETVDEQPGQIDYEDVCRQYGSSMSSLSSRVRWLNLSVTMLMTILKCSGEKDANSSRDGLDQRVNRLLTSNSELSGRMRTLHDVFDARGLQSRQPPNYLPNNGDEVMATETSTTLQRPTPATAVTAAWSPFSGYTLCSIPVLSLIALPLMTDEVRDGNDFYTFAFARQANEDVGLLMHTQTGAEAFKLRTRPAGSVTERPRSERKRWNGLASAARILSRKKKRKR